jgi:CubicO group peptidase (beta-lactamase class C family)
MKKYFAILISTFLCTVVQAQSWPSELDSVMLLLEKEEIFYGQILISENGDIKYSKAFGKNSEGSEFTTQSSMNIQSVAKWITALSILKLHEDGKLDLDDSLVKFFPTLNYPGVKVKHLLNHSSGMPKFFEVVYKNWPHDQFLTLDAMVDLIEQQKLPALSEPGTEELYNQTAYMLLTEVVEQASSQNFTDYVRRNIIEPAGMKNTFFNVEKPEFHEGTGKANIDNLFAEMLGDGNMRSTAFDLFQLDQAIRSGKILENELIELGYVPANLISREGKFGYGGSLIEKEVGKRQYQHMGQGSKSNAVVTRYLDSGDLLIILHDQTVQYAYQVYMTVKNLWEGKAYEIPKKRIVFTLSKNLINKYIGDYGENGFMHITTEDGKLFIQPDGNPSKIEIIPSSETTFYFEDQSIDWEIYLDKDGNVIGFGPAGQKNHMMIRQK